MARVRYVGDQGIPQGTASAWPNAGGTPQAATQRQASQWSRLQSAHAVSEESAAALQPLRPALSGIQ